MTGGSFFFKSIKTTIHTIQQKKITLRLDALNVKTNKSHSEEVWGKLTCLSTYQWCVTEITIQ